MAAFPCSEQGANCRTQRTEKANDLMDRYRCMQAFVQIAETGSLSGAARNLAVSKSTISERLAQLEQLVGQRLVIRSSRKFVLTDVGREAFSEFAGIVSRLQEIESIAKVQKDGLGGHLRIASAVDIGSNEIATALSSYLVDHPRMTIDLAIGDHLVDPLDGGFDLALHYRRLMHDKLKVQAIAEVECGVFAAPSYIERHGRPLTPQDLTEHRCLGYLYQKAVHEWVPSRWEFVEGKQIQSVRVALSARFNSSGTLQRFLADGHGIGILPVRRTAEAVAAGSLCRLLEGYRIAPLTLYATYPRTLIRRESIVSLLRYLERCLRI
jgi:DNA-binding transcriptional LysR family regulator